jgi:hypothetical protein
MSRAGYCDDLDQWDLIRWRGQVASAIRGKRGQTLLRELLAALDAMPAKRLIAHELRTEEGQVCALGALGAVRGIDLEKLDPEDPDGIAAAFNVAPQLVREIEYYNDEWSAETQEHRWQRMRNWVAGLVAERPSAL